MILKVGMMALLEGTERMAALDWRVAPVPWRNNLANPGRPLKVSAAKLKQKLCKFRKLQIGFYTEDGIFPPTPGMSRAVRETVDLLQKAGHEVSENTSASHLFSFSCRWKNGHLHALKLFAMCGLILGWRTKDTSSPKLWLMSMWIRA